jgi:cell division protein FtsL
LLAVVLVTALVIGLTSAQALLAEGAFRVSDLSRQAERLDVANDLMRLEVARLSSPDRIAREAAHAGLIRPRRVETLPPEERG